MYKTGHFKLSTYNTAVLCYLALEAFYVGFLSTEISLILVKMVVLIDFFVMFGIRMSFLFLTQFGYNFGDESRLKLILTFHNVLIS